MSRPEPTPDFAGEKESLEEEASHTLEEARMVLPGMEAHRALSLEGAA